MYLIYIYTYSASLHKGTNKYFEIRRQYLYHTTVANTDLFVVHPNATSIIITDNIIVEGNNVTITCEATGIPLPTIAWTFSSSLLMSDSVNITTTNTTGNGDIPRVTERLTIMNVSRALRGWHRCSASNSVGSDTSSGIFSIIVQCKYVMMLLRYCVIHYNICMFI